VVPLVIPWLGRKSLNRKGLVIDNLTERTGVTFNIRRRQSAQTLDPAVEAAKAQGLGCLGCMGRANQWPEYRRQQVWDNLTANEVTLVVNGETITAEHFGLAPAEATKPQEATEQG